MPLLRLHRSLFLIVAFGAFTRPAVAQQPGATPLPPERIASVQAQAEVIFHARDAIIRGLAYLGNPELPLDPDALLIHAYLKDRFGLPELCSAKRVASQIRQDPKGDLRPFLRLADTLSFRPEFIALQGKGFNNITLAGIWYDKLSSPSILMDRIAKSPIDEAYVATHALWAMSMARQCFHAELDTTVEQRLVEKVTERMEHSDPRWGDEAVEALAMLQYNDPNYVPPYKYIQQLVDLQNPNGSWSWNPGQEVTGSQHTTVLALWALLQYKPLAWPTQPRNMVLR
ncbi:MAG: hypothetical protein JST38_07580 [Bacteroidetes bacterium]|nr:hypothetical protein [Bacteroidota bacterium]MBS1940719.1 hypothetical protein [Bacteroidota bacterium]